MAASDVYYEIAAPIADRCSLGSSEVLRQDCIKLTQKLYQASTNLKSAKDIIRICQKRWMQQIKVQEACPVVKNKYLRKHTLKKGLKYLQNNIRSLKIGKELI